MACSRGQADPLIQLDGGTAGEPEDIVVIPMCEAVLQKGRTVDGIMTIDHPMEKQVGGVAEGIIAVAPEDISTGLSVKAVIKVIKLVEDSIGDR